VSHFVQNTLEEGYPCGCGKLFQRVYQSQNINEGRINLKEIMGMGAVSWTCRICEKEEEKLCSGDQQKDQSHINMHQLRHQIRNSWKKTSC
jgi:hypothetical protein